MLRFLRWLTAAVFVSFMIGAFAGIISAEVASRHEYRRRPNAPPVALQLVEEETFRQVFRWTGCAAFVVLIFASQLKLPVATKDIAWGALAGAAIAVVGGHLISGLRGEPGAAAKNYPETIRLTLWIGLPILVVLGGIAGYLRHRNQRRLVTEITESEATSGPQKV